MLLTILLGAVWPRWSSSADLSVWEAGILAAILAPTDAGLGQIIVNSPRVPMNDPPGAERRGRPQRRPVGAVPAVLHGAGRGRSSRRGPSSLTRVHRRATRLRGRCSASASACSAAGCWAGASARRGCDHASRQLGVVALPLLCLIVSEAIGASMFIAAFVAGLAVQVGFKEAGEHSVEFTEEWGQLLNLSVFFLFGLFVARSWPQLHAGARAVCRPEPDGGADGAGRDRAHRHPPEPHHRALHGLVRPARPRLHRARTGLPGGGRACPARPPSGSR